MSYTKHSSSIDELYCKTIYSYQQVKFDIFIKLKIDINLFNFKKSKYKNLNYVKNTPNYKI